MTLFIGLLITENQNIFKWAFWVQPEMVKFEVKLPFTVRFLAYIRKCQCFANKQPVPADTMFDTLRISTYRKGEI
jgi:hypothetical protein